MNAPTSMLLMLSISDNILVYYIYGTNYICIHDHESVIPYQTGSVFWLIFGEDVRFIY